MRGGLAILLNREHDLTIVGDLDFNDDVPPRASTLSPDVVVINTDYMVSQVLPLVGELNARNPACAVLILSDPSKRGMLPPRRRARGLSFVVKDAPIALLAEAIRRVARGERVVHPRLEAASLGTEKSVSTRELEVLGLAAEGESVDDIARRLYLSLGTVRNHLSSVIMKTGARNRIDAIRIARKDGWLR
ncbi:MAG: two-component system, NarL family, response regulator DesR [Micromonosporaceae bacterium]|nr:two-component system, NarL family, response regulator DesR [Micromonosporaceae bacterium]